MKRAACILSAALASAATAQTPGFWLIPRPPSSIGISVRGLTQDGSVAVGSTSIGNTGPGYSWTVAGGRDDWGSAPGMPAYTRARAVSSSGSVIVGWGAGLSFGPGMAFRRVGNGPVENLGTHGGWPRSEAAGVSGDGGAIVGWSHNGFGAGEAFRWTQAGGMQGLGVLPGDSVSQAHGISRDGSTIVGRSVTSSAGNPRAFRWTEIGGMQPLPSLPGAAHVSYEAFASNIDGSVIVGRAPNSVGRSRAVRWVNGAIEDLSQGFDEFNVMAEAVSDTGDVIGGTYGSTFNRACVWTPTTGMLDLRDFLDVNGIAVPSELRLENLLSISGDGLTFAGIARDLNTNVGEAFVVTIPAPASALLLLTPLCSPRRRRGL